MRRNNFFIGLVTAIVTFVTLSAFVHRPWGWHHGWRHDRYYYHDRYEDHERERGWKHDHHPGSINDSSTIYHQ